MKTSIVGLLLTLATATALAQQPSRTYSNIVINVVTSTNAVTFTDLQGHTYSNVTVKLIPYGLGWYAKDGTEGRLAITNLDDVTLADITGLSANQVEYLSYKKAMEDAADIPQEATNSTPWWLAPYPHGLNERFIAKPGLPSADVQSDDERSERVGEPQPSATRPPEVARHARPNDAELPYRTLSSR